MVLNSQFEDFRNHSEKALSLCMQSLADERANGLKEPISLTQVTEIVQTHFGPLCGEQNVLNVHGVNDEADWRKSALEAFFRNALMNIVEKTTDTSVDFQAKYDLLDMVLVSSELGYLEEVVPMSFVEEILDIHTIADCGKLFDYIERRKERLTANMVPNKGKSLILLRLCNEMLRRLSKETDTVLCGRISMFLANSFTLSERSGVNINGAFNVQPVYHDDYAEVDADPNLTDDEKSFYKLFWNTRKYYAEPKLIVQKDGGNFTEFQKGTDAILEKFTQSVASNSTEEANASTESNEKAGSKRKRTDLDPDEKKDLAEQMLKEINQEFRFPRLLSNRNLLQLEMQDIRFQRNIILQTLILLQYLSGFTPEEQDHTRQLLEARGKKQTLIQPAFTVNQEQSQWLSDTHDKLLNLLKSKSPHGELYVDIVLTLLRHERNWIIWKAAGCPPFEKPPVDTISLDEAIKRKRMKLNPSLEKYRFEYGAPEITKLYNRKHSDLSSTKPQLPEVKQVIDMGIKNLEEDVQMTPEERLSAANAVIFRVIRLLLRRPGKANIIAQIYALKKDLKKTKKEAGASADRDEGEKEEENKMEADQNPVKLLRGVQQLLN